MPDEKPRTALPSGIPAALSDFIRCRTNEVDIEAGDLDWLPKPGGMPIPDGATPGLTFENGPTPGSVSISVGWGFFSFTVTGSVVDGELVVDPPPIPGLGDQITDWVDDLNADLKANGMQLGDLSIVNGKLHFAKEPIVVASVTAPAAVTTSAPAVTSIPGPAPGSRTGAFQDKWKKAGVGAGALALGVAAFFIFVDDGTPAGTPPAPPVAAQDTPSQPPSETDGGTGTDDPTETDDGTADDDSTGSGGSSEGGTEGDSTEGDSGTGDDGSIADDPLGVIFGDLEELGESFGFAGPPLFRQPDPSGDADFCGPNDALGADITGVVVYQDGEMVSVGVMMAQPPPITFEQYSGNVSAQVDFASGASRMWIKEKHAGTPTGGEQREDGTIVPGSEARVTHNEFGVMFAFTIDPNDPIVLVSALGFNLPEEGDNIGCDQAYAFASPSPPPPSDRIGDCTPGGTVLCLNDRFQVEVDWEDSSVNGVGMGVGVDSDSGYFWFGDPANAEVFVRVVNACDVDNSYWVFSGAATDVEYTLTVTDTETGTTREYFNDLGVPAQAIQDISAFATCP